MQNNVDKHEIEKFSETAYKWWDIESEFKPLHQINPLRLNWIIQCAGPLSNLRIADIGCGGGILAESMAKQGAEVSGIDLSEAAIKVAKLHALDSELKINYQFIHAETFAEQHQHQFDIVTCMEMLEHVPYPDKIIEACAKLCKPQGHVFFSSINRNLKSYLAAIIAAEHLLKLLPKGTHDYNKLLKPSEINQFAYQHQLNLLHITGLHYHPICKTYSLGKSTDINFMQHFQKQA